MKRDKLVFYSIVAAFIIPIILFLITIYSGYRELREIDFDIHPSGLSHQTKIINAHEHFQNVSIAGTFLEAMKNIGDAKTVIVGSPEATILSGRTGFENEGQYNEVVMTLAEKYPDRFIAFPTIDWNDPENLEKLKAFHKRGAKGLKLYNGHTFFFDGMKLDDPKLFPIYEYCQKERLPILYHVNAGRYLKEFENVLTKYPKLKVICPHLCLSTIKSSRLEHLMDTYPGLYMDFSFGFVEFLNQALKRISRNPEKFQELFTKYQDRFVFGTDMVMTNAKYKTTAWLTNVAMVYRKMLELETYEFSEIPGETLRGLALDEDILNKVYYENFERFMESP